MNSTNIHKKKKRVPSCLFCKRSHVVCDDKRPCTRCVKREIGHLCSNIEPALPGTVTAKGTVDVDRGREVASLTQPVDGTNVGNLLFPQEFVSQDVGSEFSSLNEFLSILEDPLLMSPPDVANTSANSNGMSGFVDMSLNHGPTNEYYNSNMSGTVPILQHRAFTNGTSMNDSGGDTVPGPLANPYHLDTHTTPKEQFFLTAADPSTEMTPEDRLKLVINAKLEAGLLKPYDYAQGYTRLQEYMEKNMGEESRQRILKPLSSIRPAFRSIARSLKDVDLVLVEEGFERMLLGYDRVFTSMSMPACLWRRTGEIYRANKEFASLVGCTVDDLRDGKIAIYELMNEESAVNYWEKYGSIAFDKGQKAVLTSCTLRTRDRSTQRNCCFSFTIRRDRYNIPVCIVGNFIPI